MPTLDQIRNIHDELGNADTLGSYLDKAGNIVHKEVVRDTKNT